MTEKEIFILPQLEVRELDWWAPELRYSITPVRDYVNHTGILTYGELVELYLSLKKYIEG